MNDYIKSAKMNPFILQPILIIIGIAGLVVFSPALKKIGVPESVAMLIFLGIIYLLLYYYINRRYNIAEYLSIQKIGYLLVGFLVGVVIHLLPMVLAKGSSAFTAINWGEALASVTFTGFFLTFATILWEELWFRAPVLNLAELRRQEVMFSFYNGLLFALLHVLNPKIKLAVEGPELFMAGTFLTLAYFQSRSLYLPVGLHFGNNLMGALLEKGAPEAAMPATDDKLLPWLRTGVLAIGVIVLLYRRRRRITQVQGYMPG